MSGGVDSSTVAALLRAEGHDVIGLTMQLWNQRRLAGREGMPESFHGRCCSLDDVYDARRVAQQIGIPYYVGNHEERFERDVNDTEIVELADDRQHVGDKVQRRNDVAGREQRNGLEKQWHARLAKQLLV